jgi:UDP-3-O-[3-hydroxymyristoyl] glucosamine N-acyltransferase
MTYTVEELSKIAHCDLLKSKELDEIITDIATLEEADKTDCCVFHNSLYQSQLRVSKASVCIISEKNIKYAPKHMSLLIHSNPYKAFALIAQAFHPRTKKKGFIASHTHISKTASIGLDSIICHGAYIGEHVVIGQNTEIGVNAYIGDGVLIGNDCMIESNVSVMHAVIGHNAIIHAGARIGQDGFGFASDKNGHYKIPHKGGVKIGNDVEIGANTCIDRGTFNDTMIGDHCHIDNLVQIGHNVKLGKGVVLAAQTGVAGSTKVGDFVSMEV